MTLQEVFNKAWERAKTKVKSTSASGTGCYYRSPIAPPCFIGVCIPDELYHEDMEHTNVCSLPGKFPALRELFDDTYKYALMELQRIHDVGTPDNWEPQLRNFARNHHLEVPA